MSLSEIAGRCIHDKPPPCAAACPFGVDVSALLKKVAEGKQAAAYKTYAKATVFPGIVSHTCPAPCERMCIHAHAPLRVGAIEQAMWTENHNIPETAFYLPKKTKSVLVVGGGLCGLTCASKLAGRGYAVRLAERAKNLGGQILSRGAVPEAVLSHELMRLRRHENLTVSLETDGMELPWADYDVVLLAAGTRPETGGDERAIASDAAADRSPADAVLRGIRLSNEGESFLKVGAVKLPEQTIPLWHLGDFRESEPPPEPLSIEGAEAEADRCLHCKCNRCVEVCDMQRHFAKSPAKSLADIGDTLNKTEITKKTALRQMMSCSQCGLCSSGCPESIDFKQLYIESRRYLHRSGAMPLAHYDYWLGDMEFSNGIASLDFAPDNPAPAYLYFPGCQMSASSPDYVPRSYGWLLEAFPQQVGLMLHCCGAPADWAGDELLHGEVLGNIRGKWLGYGKPTVILACPTCKEMFRSHLPEIPVVSLWELMAKRLPPKGEGEKRAVHVFDPCASRYAPEDQAAVRSLVAGLGYAIEELPAAQATARCCGYGGLVYSSNPDLVTGIGGYNAAMGEKDYITYCTNCRDSFSAQKKTAWHLLDLLFFDEPQLTDYTRLGLDQRRENRLAAKRLLASRYMHVTVPEKPAEAMHLIIADALRERMDRDLIRQEHVRGVIAHAEETGSKIYREETGCYVACLRQGNLTFWAEYRPVGDGAYRLEAAYFHRMAIEE